MELAVFTAYYRLKIQMKYLLQHVYLIACWHRNDGIHQNWLLKQPLTTISIIKKTPAPCAAGYQEEICVELSALSLNEM